MNELLNLAVSARGGLERWSNVKAITVVASITGAIWFVKSKGDYQRMQKRLHVAGAGALLSGLCSLNGMNSPLIRRPAPEFATEPLKHR